jgi:hypothetical protein
MIGGATRSEVRCLPRNINFHSWAYMFIFIISNFNGSVAYRAQAYNEDEAGSCFGIF